MKVMDITGIIRDVKPDDAARICEIYNYYIKNSVITFEEQPVSLSDMKERIKTIIINYPWIVYEEDGKILAYAYGSSWKVRSAYRYSAELTVYKDCNHNGKGVGYKIYDSLIKRMEQLNIHCLYGAIALPNYKSVNLHEKLGFSKCAHFNQVGYKLKKWVDVGYWEKLL